MSAAESVILQPVESKQVAFYMVRPYTPHVSGMDVRSVLRYLNKPEFNTTECPIKFSIRCRIFNQWGSFLVASTIRTAIKHGHTDIEIWQHINKIKKSQANGDPRSRSVSVFGNTLNFSFDIDNHPYFDTIQSVKDYLFDMGLLQPAVVSQTGPFNFHVVYYGFGKEWTWENKIKFLCRFAQIEAPVSSEWELRAKLKQHGIDFQYNRGFRDHPEHEKFRIPGSINSKYVNEFGRARVVSTWFNEDYWSQEGLEVIPKIKFQVIQNVKRHIREFWKDFRQPVLDVLNKEKIFPAPAREEFSRIIADNITYLRHGDLYLSQPRLESCLDVSQTRVSKSLKLAIDVGLLVVTKEHYFEKLAYFNRRPKRYGAGPLLLELTSFKQSAKKDEYLFDVTKPYVSGKVHHQMLEDLRYLYMMSFEVEQIAKFCHTKDVESRSSVANGSIKSESDVKKMVENWAGKFPKYGRVMATCRPFLLDEKLGAFRERI